MASGVYASAAAILIIAVLAVAYGTTAPTLGVAEFAPAARNQVEPPPTTAGDAPGSAQGSNRRRGSTTTSLAATTSTPDPTAGATAAPTTRSARTRACVGNPPRQTEDPMSPSCLATIFDADNGGATSTGVSETEIRVAFPNVSGATSDAGKVITALFDHFNQRFELYGRRLVPVFVSGGSAEPQASRALAADIVSRQVFAAITGVLEWNNEVNSTAIGTLAHEGVVTVARAGSSWLTDRTIYDALHPYVWSVYQSSEDVQSNLASFVCSALAGRAARFAGDSALQSKTRRFAVLAAGYQVPTARVAIDALSSCSNEEPLRGEWAYTAGSPVLKTTLERFKAGNDPATTVVCVCDSWAQTAVFSAAQSAAFQPEWVLVPSVIGTGYDEGFMQGNRRNSYLAPPIRLGSGPRLLPLQARPWFGALQTSGLMTAPSSTLMSMAEFLYPELLVLATGIQGAGPTLTAETFAAALMSTEFPNPGAGQAPYYQPSAGFGPGDHSLYDDYNVGWWSDAATALDTGASSYGTGTWCYLGQGARFQVGRYPVDDQQLFNPALPCY